jgi:hypothetical protein
MAFWEDEVRPGRVNKPWPVPVQVGSDGTPQAVGRLAVESVREEWLVEDGWWTQRPLRRRYFELVLEDGSDVVVFCELASSDPSSDGLRCRAPSHQRALSHNWFRQRD